MEDKQAPAADFALASPRARTPGGRLSRPWGGLLAGLAWLSGLGLLALACMICVDVGYRWLFGRPILGVFEFSEILLVAITFLTIAYVQFSGRQLVIDILSARARGRLAGGLGMLDAVAGLAFFGILLWTSAIDWWEAYHGDFLGRGMLKIPTALPLGFVLVGATLMVVTLLLVLAHAGRRTLRGVAPSDGEGG